MKARKVVSPEIVKALDSRVPMEITDEILSWVVWRREVATVNRINHSWRNDGIVKITYTFGMFSYIFSVVNIGEIPPYLYDHERSESWLGFAGKINGPRFKKAVRKFWRETLREF